MPDTSTDFKFQSDYINYIMLSTARQRTFQFSCKHATKYLCQLITRESVHYIKVHHLTCPEAYRLQTLCPLQVLLCVGQEANTTQWHTQQNGWVIISRTSYFNSWIINFLLKGTSCLYLKTNTDTPVLPPEADFQSSMTHNCTEYW